MLEDRLGLHVAALLDKPLFPRLRVIKVVAGDAGLLRPFAGEDAGVVDVGHRGHGAQNLFGKALFAREAEQVGGGFRRQVVGLAAVDDQDHGLFHSEKAFLSKA